jgi:hypothetical protein
LMQNMVLSRMFSSCCWGNATALCIPGTDHPALRHQAKCCWLLF